MKKTEFKTSTIHYRVFGNGNPLVFLHGFLEDSTIWDDFILPLTKTNQIILIDLPCHGKTRFIGEICSMTFMAECVNAVLEHEKIKNPTVFGHSMGGYVGLELAKMIALKLIMLHSNFWADSLAQQDDRDRVVELVKDKKGFFIKVAIPNLFYPKNKKDCQHVITGLIKKANNIPTNEICSATLGLKTRNSNYAIIKNHDVVIIQGEYDTIMTIEQMTNELQLIKPQQKIYLIKDCGHMSIWEKPEQLLDIIQQLCK
jgi:pimeloyl-ACP methyl ester carboxylesterase